MRISNKLSSSAGCSGAIVLLLSMEFEQTTIFRAMKLTKTIIEWSGVVRR